jgi:ribonuclease HIII
MTENKEKNPSIFVATVDLKIADKLLSGLKEQNFEISTPLYTVFSGKKKGVSCTLYKSGKLTVQGKEMSAFLEFYLEPEILGTFTHTYQDLNLDDLDPTGRIGIDESGKGDFFGPLCVAGVYAEGDAIAKLKKLGVCDSKDLSDAAILKIAKAIRAEFTHHIVKINPLKYNELYQQFGNLNHLLAWGHATAIEQLVLKSNCRNVIIDQFAAENVVITALKRKKLTVTLTQRHRGEEDLVVAAASILARETFLKGLEELGQLFGVVLPKGASAKTIQVGRNLLAKFGRDALEKTGKMHFKTLNSIL